MNANFHPVTRIRGELRLPGDKSISHRAAMLASLASGTSEIEGFLTADDCLNTLACLQQLGVEIERCDTNVKVVGHGLHSYHPPESALYVGNSGTTIRLMMGIVAAQSFETVLDGDASIRARPMDRIAKPLTAMGARVSGRADRCLAPVSVIGGSLSPIEYEMPVASAQVKSAILLAALHATGTTTVVEPAKSRDHTERMLRHFGVQVWEEGKKVAVRGPTSMPARRLLIPGDISSAAFFVVAAAILPGSTLVVRDVLLNPTRAAYLDVLRDMGADIAIQNEHAACGEPVGDVVVRGGELRSTTIEGERVPLVIDEIPVLAVAAATAEGETVIRDAGELRVKESDRIRGMTRELNRLGAKVQETADGMIIAGVRRLRGGNCESYGDHRVAMSLAVAALKAEGETCIHEWECTSTSFPEFKSLFERLTEGMPG